MAMFSKNPDEWLDPFELKTSNFDINSSTSLERQWERMSKAEQWEEIEITFDALADADKIIEALKVDNENLKKELRDKGGTWLDTKFSHKCENN